MKFVMPIIASLVISSSAYAGDAFNFKLLGFSKNSNVVAFAKTVIADGSGFGLASITVIDTKANKVLKEVTASDESETSTEESAFQKALSQINLNSFGVKIGENLGTTLVQRLPTDHSGFANTVFSVQAGAEGGSLPIIPKYELTLTTKNAPKSDSCYFEEDKKMMKLTLKNLKGGDVTPVNFKMQDDTKLPKSRGCALGYTISQVVQSGDALVVVLKYAATGFEGPDTNYMLVTAQVKLK